MKNWSLGVMECWNKCVSAAVFHRPLPYRSSTSTGENQGGGDSSIPSAATRLKSALLLLALLLAFGSRAASAASKSITFAYNTPTLSGTLPIVVAQDFGFFAKAGLDVRTVFIRGGPTAMAALVGGGVDYTFVAGVASVRAIAQNAPMQIISGIQPYMDYTLIGSRSINSVNDLKGKVVGVTGPGGVAEFAAVEGLAKKGMVRDRDYKILYGVGNSPARAQALETGKIQASPFSFLERLELERKGFTPLFDIGDVIPDFPFVVIASTKQKIDSDPEEIVALLRAINRGLDFLKNNRDKVADAVIKKNKFGDPATVRQVINRFADQYSISIDKQDIEALIAATRIEADAKKLGGPEKFFTRQFLIKASGQNK